MKWVADNAELGSRRFEIKHDPLVGYYLYIFENEKCVRDHLEDTLNMAIATAREDYNVSEEAWEKTE